MDKAVQRIIDGTEPKEHDYRRPGKPMPSIMEVKRKPDEHMKWHLRHKPYGGETIADDKRAPEQLPKTAAGDTTS